MVRCPRPLPFTQLTHIASVERRKNEKMFVSDSVLKVSTEPMKPCKPGFLFFFS